MSMPAGYVPSEMIGPYPVEGAAGWGGFADVFKSRASDGTPVVIKVGIRRGGMASRTFAQNVLPARAGIDMALHMIARLGSREHASEVRREMQYDPAPPALTPDA